MPPTAKEVKARLKKAIDEEGNVLNIEAVNEMTSWLEKITITAEVLQETGIGLKMNNLRKKVKNNELAKRIKTLIRKWKEDLEKLKTNNGLDTTQAKQNTKQNNPIGVKRKFNNTEDVKLRTSSPKVQSPSLAQRKHQSSPNRNHTRSPRPSTSSPRVSTSQSANRISTPSTLSPKRSNSRPSSRNNVSSPLSKKHARNTPSPLVTNHTNSKETIPDSRNNNCSLNNQNNKTKANNENGVHDIDKKNSIEVTKEQFDLNNKDTDTRIQEDRISSIDSGYQGTLSDEFSPTELSPADKFVPIDKPPEILHSPPPPSPSSFEAIEEENLEVNRKDYVDNPTSPSVVADGVNGLYDDSDNFCTWTDEVNHGEFAVLPYVILD